MSLPRLRRIRHQATSALAPAPVERRASRRSKPAHVNCVESGPDPQSVRALPGLRGEACLAGERVASDRAEVVALELPDPVVGRSALHVGLVLGNKHDAGVRVARDRAGVGPQLECDPEQDSAAGD